MILIAFMVMILCLSILMDLITNLKLDLLIKTIMYFDSKYLLDVEMMAQIMVMLMAKSYFIN